MRVVIADDRAHVRSGLRLLLEQVPQIELVGEVADAAGLLPLLRGAAPDLLLLDWELPGLAAGYLLRLLRDEQPQLLAIAMSSRPEAQQEALAAGVDGFLSKGDPPDRLLDTIYRLLPAKGR